MGLGWLPELLELLHKTLELTCKSELTRTLELLRRLELRRKSLAALRESWWEQGTPLLQGK